MREFQKTFLALGVISLAVCYVAVTPLLAWAARKSSKTFTISARSVIFSNSTQVKRLYGKHVSTKIPPASTVKVMTALLALERLSLDQSVTISSRATLPQPSKIGVVSGEQYDVQSLLYAILLQSANDAAVALAEAVAGSEEGFVALMNRRAQELGCKNTKFSNPHGLPKPTSQYTTAYDMYLIFREALNHPFFRNAIALRQRTIYSLAGREIKLRSHNKILFSDWRQKVFGKTGYTHAARSCFVGYLQKGEDILIIAIFGCASGRRWKEIRHIISKYGAIAL